MSKNLIIQNVLLLVNFFIMHQGFQLDSIKAKPALTCTPTVSGNTVYTSSGIINLLFNPSPPILTGPTGDYAVITYSLNWLGDYPRAIMGPSWSGCQIQDQGQLATSAVTCSSLPSTSTEFSYKCALTSSTNQMIICSGANTPTSQGTFGNIAIITYSGTYNPQLQTITYTQQQSCSQIQISNWQVNLINSPIFLLSNPTPTPNTPAIGTVSFTTSSPLYLLDEIYLNFLQPIITSSLTTAGGQQTFNILTPTNQNQVILQLTGVSKVAPGLFQIYLHSIISGPSIKPQQLIGVITQRNSTSFMIDQNVASSQIFAQGPGLIQFTSVNPTNSQINVATTYVFTIILTNPLKSDGFIEIYFPSPLILGGGVSCTLANTNSATNAGTTSTSSYASGTILSISSSAYPQYFSQVRQNLILSVSNVNNPSKTDQTIVFSQIQSYYSAQTADKYEVDEIQNIPITVSYQPGVISSLSITGSSLVVGQITTIQFTFINTDAITASGIVIFTIPQGTVFNIPNQNPKCMYNGNPESCTLSLSSDLLTATVTGIFPTSAYPNGIPAQTNNIIQLTNCFRNPYSTAPVYQFSVQTARSDNVLIDQLLLSGSYTINTPSDMTSVQLTSRGSTVNGALTSYLFTLIFLTPQQNGASLFINTAGLIIDPNGPTCSTDGSILASSISCSVNPQGLLQIILTCGSVSNCCPNNYVPNAISIKITVNNIQNPISFQPSSYFTFKTSTTDGYSISLYSGVNVVITDTLPGLISSTSMTSTIGILGESDVYTFQFTVTNLPPATTTYFTLQVPGTVIIFIQLKFILPSSLTCKAVMGFIDDPSCTANNQLITVTPKPTGLSNTNGVTNTKTFSFTISSFQNPQSITGNSAFQITSFQTSQSVSYEMDQTDINDPNLIFKSTRCTLPCRTCYSQITTQCLTCYQNSITSSKYYYPNTLSCGQICTTGYYLRQADLTCLICSTNCKTCDQNQVCTVCLDTYILYQAQCITQCPAGTYFDGQTCSACSSNCNTCSGSSTNCTSCTGLFLYQGTCISTCPAKLFTINQQCIPCMAPCLTCGSGPSICTSCNPNSVLFLLQGQKCVATCDSGNYPSSGVCLPCVSPCDTCTSSTQCINCLQSSGKPYLLVTTCYSTCPPLYTPDGTNCTKCALGCSSCNSLSCLTCSANYYLLGTKCVSSCPTGYIIDPTQISCVLLVVVDSNSSSTPITSLPSPIIITPSPQVSNSTVVVNSNIPVVSNSTVVSNISVVSNSSVVVSKSSVPPPVVSSSSISNTTHIDAAQTTVYENLSSNRYIPFPHLIMFLFIGLSIIVGKLHRQETFIAGAIVGLGGLIIFSSWIVVITLYLKQHALDQKLYPLIATLVANYILNLINIIFVRLRFIPDPFYRKWLVSKPSCNIAAFISYTLSIFGCFMVTRVLTSRVFGFKFFKAKLSNTDILLPFNIINGVSILACCVPACVSSVLVAYSDSARDQLFISSLDCLIVNLLMIIFLIMDTQKEENFFEENDAFYFSLNQTNKVEKGDDFFQSKHSFFQKKQNQPESGEEASQVQNQNDTAIKADLASLSPKNIEKDKFRKSTLYFGQPNKSQEGPRQNKNADKIVEPTDIKSINEKNIPQPMFLSEDVKNQMIEPQALKGSSKVQPNNMGKNGQTKTNQIVDLDPDDEPNYPNDQEQDQVMINKVNPKTNSKNQQRVQMPIQTPIEDDTILRFDEPQSNNLDQSMLSVQDDKRKNLSAQPNSINSNKVAKNNQIQGSPGNPGHDNSQGQQMQIQVENLDNDNHENGIVGIPTVKNGRKAKKPQNNDLNSKDQQGTQRFSDDDDVSDKDSQDSIIDQDPVMFDNRVNNNDDQVSPQKNGKKIKSNPKNNQKNKQQQILQNQKQDNESSLDNAQINMKQRSIPQDVELDKQNNEKVKIKTPNSSAFDSQRVPLKNSFLADPQNVENNKQEENEMSQGDSQDSDYDPEPQQNGDLSKQLGTNKLKKQLTADKNPSKTKNTKDQPQSKTQPIKKNQEEGQSKNVKNQKDGSPDKNINQNQEAAINAKQTDPTRNQKLQSNENQQLKNIPIKDNSQNPRQVKQGQNKPDQQIMQGDQQRTYTPVQNDNFQGENDDNKSQNSQNSQNSLEQIQYNKNKSNNNTSNIKNNKNKNNNNNSNSKRQMNRGNNSRSPAPDTQSDVGKAIKTQKNRNMRSQEGQQKALQQLPQNNKFFEEQGTAQRGTGDKSQIIQKSKSNNKSSQPARQNPAERANSQKIQNQNGNRQVYDSNESIHTLSDPDWGENQLSPSDFNALNQRYDDEFQQVQRQKQPQQQTVKQSQNNDSSKRKTEQISKNYNASVQPSTKLVKNRDSEASNNRVQNVQENTIPSPGQYDQQGSMFDEFSKNYVQPNNGRLKEVEKIYLQRLENNKQPKRRTEQRNGKIKDSSDALYVDDKIFDENDIDF